MTRTVQLLHLTDPHLRAEVDERLHGWQVQKAFDTVLDAALQRYPDIDALVLGGDLVDDETTAGYARLNRRLAALDRPVLAMAGNHDDPARLAQTLTNAHVHTALTVGGWQLIALDSHRSDSEGGRLGLAQIEWLEQRLHQCRLPAIVFLHHPPVAVGSEWLDAIGLDDAPALRRCLQDHGAVRAVVCGHSHQAHHARFAGLDCWSTPATMRQFRPGSPVFAEDRVRAPGYRWLTLAATDDVATGVERVDAARRACG